MRRSWLTLSLLALPLFFMTWPTAARAQGVREPRGPQFLLASGDQTKAPVPVDASSVAALRRRVQLDLDGVPLRKAIAEISRASGLEIVYAAGVVPRDGRVVLKAEAITVAAALTEVLLDAGVDVVLSPGGNAVLVKRTAARAPAAGTIVGRVTDGKTGDGLGGAEVLLEGTRWRANTGADGRYRLADVQPGSYTLVARRVGYGRQSRAIVVAGEQEVTVDIALLPVATQLNEIVTTATGDQRRVELGHVVGRINADSLVKEAPVSSLSELLTARVPGLQVFQSQGTVGGHTTVRIRGPNSLIGDNEPIVVVDGVRYTTALRDRTATSGPGNVEPSSPLNDLNPNDIESIEVVKGPSAATLYGTDAVNGVIVVTTKRGRPGPARWSVYAKGTQSAIPQTHFPDLYWGWGTRPNGQPFPLSCTLQFMVPGFCRQDSVTVLSNPLNDPELTLFGAKPRWEYGLNVAGGHQDLRYYLSADFEDATGPIQLPVALAEQLKAQRGVPELPDEVREPNAFTKLNLRSNLLAGLGRRGEVRLSTAYVQGDTRTMEYSSAYNSQTIANSPYVGAFRGITPAAPYARGLDPAQVFSTTSSERTERFLGNVNGTWHPTVWLATRATLGLDLTSATRYSLARRGEAPNDPFAAQGAVGDDRSRQRAASATLDATATTRRGRLSARTTVGANYTRTLQSTLASSGTNLPPGGSSVQEAVNRSTSQTYRETVVLGSYLEEMLGLNDRLFLTGAVRVDGASTFGRGYDAALYPKASASWLLSEEPFVPRLPGLDELRLRYAYGASGQQPQPAWAKPGFSPGQMVLNGQTVSSVRNTSLGNPDLRPERVREHEFGFDATALASRLRLEVTWFRRRTTDQLVNTDLPLGLSSTRTNLGLTSQRGFEADLTARLLDTRRLSWEVTLQHSSYTTLLEKLGTGGIDGSSFLWRVQGGWKEGYPLGARFERRVAGYADANGDGLLGTSEVQLSDTLVYLGQSTPPRTQTLTSVVGLFERRLRLSATFERKTGFTQVNALSCVYAQACRAQVDRSTPLAEQARLFDAPVEPGDFTRLREVTAALDLPSSLVRALRLRSATVVVSGRNLALWTDFSGPDPESAPQGRSLGSGGGSLAGGTADGVPQSRVFSLRLDLGL